LDKCSGIPVKVVGCVTSLGSLGWTDALETLEGLDGDQFDDDFVMSDHEEESLFDGLRFDGL